MKPGEGDLAPPVEEISRPSRKVDITLFFAVFFLLFIGIGMVMSAAISTDQPFRLFSRQLVSGGIALTVMLVVAGIDYHRWLEWRLFLYGGGMLSLVALYIPHVGMVMNGARRWIHLAGLTLQPSELARDAMIILTAALLVKARKQSSPGVPPVLPRKNLISFGVFLGLYVLLILREPDFGSCCFMIAVLFLMFFLGDVPFALLGRMAALSLPVALWFLFHHRYTLERFSNFRMARHASSAAATQLGQSLVALGAGGVTGAGLGHDWVGGGILPEPGTDFIFALVGEQLGLVGTLFVVFLFVMVFYRGMHVAKRAPDFAGRILALGFTLSIAIEAIFNMGVATGLLPTKGIPLPFMSFGGSSLLANALGVGVILSVSRFARPDPVSEKAPSLPESSHAS
ncbi:MAG: FtsW/RodA/SpoVE family cell cycle protein [Nitrospirae bacterium]|nr:FtsW/RodA/SpoVE family cell cycle protein [Nitrospirota bacterium]